MSTTITQNHIEVFLSHFSDVKSNGANKWKVICPCHDDHKPSLNITVGDVDKIIMNCPVCQADGIAVCRALNIPAAEMFPAKASGYRSPFVQDIPAAKPAQKKEKLTGKIVSIYDYTDETGSLLYQVCRYDPKGFRQRRPDGNGGYTWQLNGVLRVPFQLPELLASEPREWLYICEGEKDVNTLKVMFRATATCSAGGTGSYRQWEQPEFIKHFKNRHIVILPDCDDPGRKFAKQVAAALLNVASDVRVVHLPGLSEKQDVSNWVDAGNSLEQLHDLINKTRPFELDDRPEKSKCVTVTVGDVEPEPVEWLWRDRIPSGKLTIIGGDPGVGKSFMSLSIAAHVSSGTPFPDQQSNEPTEPGKVILLSAEDDIADTIRPRLDAMNADCSNIVAIKAIKQDEKECLFDLGLHIRELESAIIKAGNARLIVIDPVSAYIGTEKDGHSNTQIRGILSPLSDLAAKYKAAIVCITHLNKNSANNSAIYRLMGSLAWSAAARAVWGVVKDTQSQDDPLYKTERRLMLPLKCNLSVDAGTGLGFTIQDGAVVWDTTPIQQTAQDFYDKQYQATHKRGPEPTARDAAVDWWLKTLQNGPLWADDVWEKADQDGMAIATLKRAKKEAGVLSEQTRNPEYPEKPVWYMGLSDQLMEVPDYK